MSLTGNGHVIVGVVDQGTEKVQHYVACIEAAGGRAEVLGWRGGRDPFRDAEAFDAYVLCGGDDIDAAHFREPNHPRVTLDDPRRDAYEIAFCRRAAVLGVPLLAVCRGAQVLNVALGGTLVQHIPDLPGAGRHDGGVRHTLRLAADSHLVRLRGASQESLAVNSYHHQAVGRVAPALRSTAWSEDGCIEAVEGPGPFLVGVQWHPERDGNDGALGADLFGALLDAVRISA